MTAERAKFREAFARSVWTDGTQTQFVCNAHDDEQSLATFPGQLTFWRAGSLVGNRSIICQHPDHGT